MASERTANLLGALSQLTHDSQLDAIKQRCNLNPSEAAALVTVSHEPGQPIDFLHQTLGRSHSASVRLVNKLVERGLLTRRSAQDGRAVALHLSSAGKRCVKQILDARHESLSAHLKHLNAQERDSLDQLLAKLLIAATPSEQSAYQVCRLCDAPRCDACPMDEKFGA